MSDMHPAAVTRHEVVVDPRDGTILDLTTEPHPLLVDVLLEIRRRETQLKDWRTAVEDELVRRHGDRRSAEVVGAHEVDVDRGFSRVWDADELEMVAVDLVSRGLVRREDVDGLVEDVLKVDGRKAQSLLNRVDGDALAEIRRCFTWAQKGRAKVKVTPVVEL